MKEFTLNLKPCYARLIYIFQIFNEIRVVSIPRQISNKLTTLFQGKFRNIYITNRQVCGDTFFAKKHFFVIFRRLKKKGLYDKIFHFQVIMSPFAKYLLKKKFCRIALKGVAR